jgi:DNA-binding MarR family transcriptional regulator
MSSLTPPQQIGALLRFLLHDVRDRIYEGVVKAGFDDVNPAHVTLFRWPGPDGRRPTEIAADAQITKQAVNDLLRDLEERGYLERHADPSDNRARIVRLTRRGKQLHKVAVGIHAQVEDEWAAELGRKDFARLRDQLDRLVSGSRRDGAPSR